MVNMLTATENNWS